MLTAHRPAISKLFSNPYLDMCGRFTLTTPAEAIAESFGLDTLPPIAPRYNIAPSQPVVAIRVNARSQREVALLFWGLIPPWSKDPNRGPRPINARAETLAEKPMFKGLLRHKRCLVPADGFYEWKQAGGHKHPYHIHLAEYDPFAFAGLWSLWPGPNGEELESCTIVTTAATETMRQVHARMPVILPRGRYSDWLDPAMQDVSTASACLQDPELSLQFDAVSTLVNNPRNDSPQCIEPIG